jgi:DNA-binding MarR family transcriptional regulator
VNIGINIINELLVDTFNDILEIEQKSIQYMNFKDLSISEVHTIDAIGMYDPKRMTEIAGKLDITLGTLTIAINHLVKKEYVIRKRSDIDRRIVYISLTKKGELAYRIHQKFHQDMINECVKELSESEKKILIQSLKKLTHFFKSKYNVENLKNKYVKRRGRDE